MENSVFQAGLYSAIPFLDMHDTNFQHDTIFLENSVMHIQPWKGKEKGNSNSKPVLQPLQDNDIYVPFPMLNPPKSQKVGMRLSNVGLKNRISPQGSWVVFTSKGKGKGEGKGGNRLSPTRPMLCLPSSHPKY